MLGFAQVHLVVEFAEVFVGMCEDESKCKKMCICIQRVSLGKTDLNAMGLTQIVKIQTDACLLKQILVNTALLQETYTSDNTILALHSVGQCQHLVFYQQILSFREITCNFVLCFCHY